MVFDVNVLAFIVTLMPFDEVVNPNPLWDKSG